MTLAIYAAGLGKRYRLGEYLAFNRSLRETVGDLLSWRRRPKATPDDSSDSAYLWALKNIDLEVEPGETLGIIGRNGSGKSTLLKLLSRITLPTTGHAEIWGQVRSLLEVGTGMHPDLTGRENIYLNGAILGMKRKEVDRRYDAIVAFSGVERFLDTPLKRYSTGMRVRLGFAVAAHMEPDILLVDEVLSVGDADFRNRCVGKMENVADSGRTVVFVSHNLQAVRNLCRTAIWLKDGRLELQGTSTEVISAYLADSQQATFDGNVTSQMHSVASPKLEVFRVEISNDDGETSTDLLLDEPLRVRMLYRVHEPNINYSLGLILRSFDGSILAVSLSRDHLDRLDNEVDKKHAVNITIENRLSPGQYLLEVNVKGAGERVDRIEGITFTVEAARRHEGPPARLGLIQLPAEWNQPKVVQEPAAE